MMAASYLSDRQRRELAILPRIIWAVISQESALQADNDDDATRLRELITETCQEPLQGLHGRDRIKVANQIDRLAREIVATDLEGAPNAKVVAVCWHVLAHLVESGALEIHEDTPMAEAAAILEPAFAHIYAEPAVARSIDKQARRLLDRLHSQSLWTIAPALNITQAA